MKLIESRSMPAHLASRSANGLAASASSSVMPLPTMAAMRSRAVASMSRNSATCALPATAPPRLEAIFVSVVAAIGVVDRRIAAVIVEEITREDDVGVRKINPAVPVGMRVGGMGEQRLAATNRHSLGAAHIGFGRDRIWVRRWALVVVEAIAGACKQADPHIVLRH